MDVFLVVRALDANYALIVGAALKVRFDGGAPIDVAQTSTVGEFEILIPPGTSTASVLVSKKGFWDGAQDLTLTLGTPPSIAWNGAQTLAARNFEAHSRTGPDFNLVVNMVVMQLRDAKASVDAVVSAGGMSYLTPQGHVIRDLDDRILDPSGKGWDQLKHSKTGGVKPTGKVYFAERGHTPKLFAIYRPNGMARSFQVDGGNPQHLPIPFHLFFHPHIPAHFGETPYPFGTKYIDLIARYLFYPQVFNIGKAMVNQHHLSPDPCVFAFPVGHIREWFGELAKQTNLLRFFQEAAYFLQRMDGVSYPMQGVGRCAISAFSAGAEQLKIMMDTPDAAFLEQLREIYAFDPYLPGNEFSLCNAFGAWLQKGADDRKLRMYTQNPSWYGFAKQQLPSATESSGPENAKVSDSSAGTSLLVPHGTFWTALRDAIPKPWATGTLDEPPVVWDDVHSLMPALFMSHARKKGQLWKMP